ncbi:RusA family crossover junction endodeoxyribonuclease [Lapidilactobacillus luobeiensis]|uniref:RusA family crossover junction endodeoxyribonuclease n=1 Tax=Lapidilactobacillus luobeiensis TaxID=2950371 RepID=UPI0021C3A8C6|nr:RusA family crossover junction endodeoxyribonuclease [Lapidilactobacillus luobeiensis]
MYRYLPKSGSKALKLRRLNGDDRPTVKPDIDNYFKAVTDAVKGILWVDDNQIVESFISKYYSDDPRVELEITQI